MSFESIHNYYEKLVFNEIVTKLQTNNDDFICDVACVALNQLPSRYVRHNVDMVFYMSAQERQQIEQDVRNAVEFAVDYVSKHLDTVRPQTYSQPNP